MYFVSIDRINDNKTNIWHSQDEGDGDDQNCDCSSQETEVVAAVVVVVADDADVGVTDGVVVVAAADVVE